MLPARGQRALCGILGAIFLLVDTSLAQSSSVSSTVSASSSASIPVLTSLSLTTSLFTIVTSSLSGDQTVPVTTVLPVVFNATVTITPTRSSSSAASSASASASPSPQPIVLETRLDPAFGVLGGILILSGLPCAFLGHKNRWSSFFLMGFYTLSLTCTVLILKFGVLTAVNPPREVVRGMFILSSVVSGVVGGGLAIFFWKGARFLIGGWGGFVIGLWVQSLHNGGLVTPIGLRYILYIACTVIGFTLCTITKFHYHVVIVSTSLVGATAFILGVDCFTTAGLKEFYIWNLGFDSLFPKFTDRGIAFPVGQVMQIELGLIGAVAIMGVAVQLRVLKILQRKLQEITADQARRDEEEEGRAAQRFAELDQERDDWEKDHSGSTLFDRKDSGLSSIQPLMKSQEGSTAPTDWRRGSPLGSGAVPRERRPSNVSDFLAAPRPDEDILPIDGRKSQTPGALPAMDLGKEIQNDVPAVFMADETDKPHSSGASSADVEEIQRKEALLTEIQTIRRSIQELRDDQSAQSMRSRSLSLGSRSGFTPEPAARLSRDGGHVRPPRAQDPRAHSPSSAAAALTPVDRASYLAAGTTIARPTSAPVREDWDNYVLDRTLLQPPAGVTTPIPTTGGFAPRLSVAPAVVEALVARERRNSTLETEEAPPSATAAPHRRSAAPPQTLLDAFSSSSPLDKNTDRSSRVPTILPPNKASAAAQSSRPSGSRTRTYEEMTERHREKMRELQAPLSEAEKERAQLEQAKARWERARAVERESVGRRQVEKAAAVAKEDGRRRSHDPSRLLDLEANRTSSHRNSILKVENWQMQVAEGAPAKTRAGERGADAKRKPAPLRQPLS